MAGRTVACRRRLGRNCCRVHINKQCLYDRGRNPPVTPPHRNSVLCSGKDPCVVYHSGPREPAHYQCFDETFLKTLEMTDWDRNNGIVEFMPLVVGVTHK